MLYGFSGAHRTGKSTLARAMAAESNGTYVPVNVASVLSTLGTDSINHQKDDIDTFIATQNAILNHMESIFENSVGQNDSWDWTDRTPLDVWTYTQAYTNMAFYENEKNASKFYCLSEPLKIRCQQMLKKYFDGVFLVPYGIPIIPDAKSAVSNSGCIDYVQTLMEGNLIRFAVKSYRHGFKPFYYIIPSDILDLEQRQIWCWTTIMETMDVRSDKLH